MKTKQFRGLTIQQHSAFEKILRRENLRTVNRRTILVLIRNGLVKEMPGRDYRVPALILHEWCEWRRKSDGFV